ncbi:hypothetical protein Glove_423g73 [Diversispora epigaea]|uniref:Uncharacterized protein n=1 Tax=Diversispora epigaea TaxID=1348612 RepID=A0A397H2X6_9GLOM|nr:hypothetical protein Glove_423g73 [Diversispora epigaea]
MYHQNSSNYSPLKTKSIHTCNPISTFFLSKGPRFRELSTMMYVCYIYHDYRKEFNVEMKKIFPKLSDAITYAKSLTDKGEDRGVQFICHEGKHYDSHAKNSVYGRVAVDHVETYLKKPIESRKKMYIVYHYHNYRSESCAELHCAFDKKKKALEFASKLSDEEDNEPVYIFCRGNYFDRSAVNKYGRIAVDSISVGKIKSSEKKIKYFF